METKNIIITGGAGFIGSNLAEALKDHNLTIIDNLHTGTEENIRSAESGATFKKMDVKDIGSQTGDFDSIYHLGFYSASPMYRDNPNLVSEVIAGMIAVLEFSVKNSSPLVFSSTSSIYNGIPVPHREDIIPKVSDFYTEARIASERLAGLYAKLHGVNVAAMRFFSVYGYHEKAKGGYANLATQFLWEMMGDRSPVVYGDGTQRRDFVFVTDVVDALIKASSIRGYDVFNVGYGKNYDLNELVSKLNSLLGKNIAPKYIEMPVKNYVMETLADVSNASAKLGFRAKIDLDKGLRLIHDYYR
ncbi:nucleoside-diphosphate sugar epimerase [uncultured archaeon]|nr:nucleoside-diphosphate sugar epimerase [uncultured archaeon]